MTTKEKDMDTPIEVLTELLRLYEWRFGLAKEEEWCRDVVGTAHQEDLHGEGKYRDYGWRRDALTANLRKYGTEKKAAWERARKVIEAASAVSEESLDGRCDECRHMRIAHDAALGYCNFKWCECPKFVAGPSDSTPAPIARCPICDWPMDDKVAGCQPDNCAYRPREGSAEWQRIRERRHALGMDALPAAPADPQPEALSVPEPRCAYAGCGLTLASVFHRCDCPTTTGHTPHKFCHPFHPTTEKEGERT